MNKDYNQILEEIIQQYGCCAKNLIDSTKVHDIVLDMFQTKCLNKKVAIWGVGRNNSVNSHAAVIINKYILNLQGLSYLIDGCVELQGKEFMGYPIIAPSEIAEKKIDIVIIGSRASRKSITENLLEVAPDCEYIDIYEELKDRGIEIAYNFYNDSNTYTELYKIRKEYECGEEEKRAENLKELIALYLKIRDFHYAEHYLNEYHENKFPEYEKLDEMWGKIKKLLQEVQNINRKRKGDVTVFFIDSLRAMDVYGQDENGRLKFNLLKEYLKDGVVFKNAYSTGATTYESMISIIKQKYPFEKNVYADGFMFDFEDFELLNAIRESGRKITFYTAQDYYIMNPSEKYEIKEHLHMSEKLWNVACDMAKSDKPVFNFVSFTWELHFPLLCGFLKEQPQIRGFFDVGTEDMSGFIITQLEDCLKYVDLQFDYYKKFFSKDMMSIFFGDHSQVVYEKKQLPYFAYCKEVDYSVHVAFAICHPDLTPQIVETPFSMIDFNKVVKKAVLEKEICIPAREILRFEYYNVHNKKLIQIAKDKHLEDYIHGIHGFITKDCVIIITATGKKEISFLTEAPDEKEQEAYLEEIVERIEKEQDCSFPSFLDTHFG